MGNGLCFDRSVDMFSKSLIKHYDIQTKKSFKNYSLSVFVAKSGEIKFLDLFGK